MSEISLRWSMKKQGETERKYIMYGERESVITRAANAGYDDVQPAGYYDKATNTVVSPDKADEYVFMDNRLSGILYSK